jgi:hypothetical protein
MKVRVEIYHRDRDGKPVTDETYYWYVHYSQNLGYSEPRLTDRSKRFLNDLVQHLEEGYSVDLKMEKRR